MRKQSKIKGIWKTRVFVGVSLLLLGLLTACGQENAANMEVVTIPASSDLTSESADASADAAELDQGEAVEEVEETSQAESGEIRLVMVGDMLLHDGLEEYAKQEDGSWDYSDFFLYTEDLIREADLAIANQEVMLGGEELGISGYPAFNGPFAFGDELVDVGFDVILHGTNHALDRGAKGIRNALNFWEESYPEMAVLGIHPKSEDPVVKTDENGNEIQISYSPDGNVLLYGCNGLTLAILNYTYSTNGIEQPYQGAVNMLDEGNVIPDLEWAEEHADFTIVCPHWGTEYYLGVSSYQSYWTQIFLEHGVDLVLGTHPHVIEPIEWVEDQESGHRMLVYYSLGNYINWTAGSGSGTADRMVGGMACVTISRNEGGEAEITEDDVVPLICHLSNTAGELSVYPFSEYSEELGAVNAIKGQDSAFSYRYCEELIEEVWGDDRKN